MTNEDLLSAIARQNEPAFEALYANLEREVTGHVARIVRDTAATDDLVQDIFLRVWQRADQWSRSGPARSWVLTIATNLALNHKRTVTRRREQPLERKPDPHAEEDEALEPGWMIDEAAANPESEAEWSEQRRLLNGFVNELPEEKREVFRMIHDAEFEIREVAEQLGIPEGTVKSRMHHVRRHLAHRLRDLED